MKRRSLLLGHDTGVRGKVRQEADAEGEIEGWAAHGDAAQKLDQPSSGRNLVL